MWVTGGTQVSGMSDRASRYFELARRCRVNASLASTDRGTAGLVKMAEAYDQRGDELVSEHRQGRKYRGRLILVNASPSRSGVMGSTGRHRVTAADEGDAPEGALRRPASKHQEPVSFEG